MYQHECICMYQATASYSLLGRIKMILPTILFRAQFFEGRKNGRNMTGIYLIYTLQGCIPGSMTIQDK